MISQMKWKEIEEIHELVQKWKNLLIENGKRIDWIDNAQIKILKDRIYIQSPDKIWQHIETWYLSLKYYK